MDLVIHDRKIPKRKYSDPIREIIAQEEEEEEINVDDISEDNNKVTPHLNNNVIEQDQHTLSWSDQWSQLTAYSVMPKYFNFPTQTECFQNDKSQLRLFQMEEFLNSWRSMTEDQLARMVMFKVEDRPCPPGSANKAAESLPINLSFRPSFGHAKDSGVTGIWTNVSIPAGTRFGPLVGRLCSVEDAENTNIDKKYFWRIHDR